MIARGFRKLFWGLLFVFLDFRINRFDVLLPDFVGYILLTVGLGALSARHVAFRNAQVAALAMIFLSFADFLPSQNLVISSISTLGDLVMMWELCRGIIELATAAGNPALAQMASTRRMFYVVLTLVGWVLVMASGAIAGADNLKQMLLVMGPLVVFGLVVMVLLMGLMRRAGRELQD